MLIIALESVNKQQLIVSKLLFTPTLMYDRQCCSHLALTVGCTKLCYNNTLLMLRIINFEDSPTADPSSDNIKFPSRSALPIIEL